MMDTSDIGSNLMGQWGAIGVLITVLLYAVRTLWSSYQEAITFARTTQQQSMAESAANREVLKAISDKMGKGT